MANRNVQSTESYNSYFYLFTGRCRWVFWIYAFLQNQTDFYRLTQTERDELARKFKYYHNSVRPTAPENIVTNRNGTYFSVNLQIHILSTNLRTVCHKQTPETG